MVKYLVFSFFAVYSLLMFPQAAAAQTTMFTYQGSLKDGANAANGNYDFEFRLFNALTGGAQQGSTTTVNSVAVANGIFSVSLNFGNEFPGAGRFLEIRVRPASGGAFTPLAPRQPVNSTPYAIRSLNAASADTVSVAGVPAGSGNYVQNTTVEQPATNFNISGTGTLSALNVEGNLTFDAGGDPIIYTSSAAGEQNRYVSLINSAATPNASGLKAGGVLIADNYQFANPGKNDLVVKGRVGINTSQATARLTVFGINSGTGSSCGAAVIGWGSPVGTGCGNALAVTTNDSSFGLIEGINPLGTVFRVNGLGHVGINVFGVVERPLHVNGRARVGSIPLEPSTAAVCFNAVGDLLQCGASSLRLKHNVRQYTDGLEILRSLRPISFSWNEGGLADLGLGAEEVAQVAPSLVFTNEKGEAAGVKYERLNMLLINSVKEQQVQIEAQQKKMENQQAEIEAQAKEIAELKRVVCELRPEAKVCNRP